MPTHFLATRAYFPSHYKVYFESAKSYRQLLTLVESQLVCAARLL